MKSKFIAPMLLLALGAACGKTQESSLDAVQANELTAASKSIRAIANKLNSGVEAKKAVQDVAEIANAAAKGNAVGAAGNAPVVATVSDAGQAVEISPVEATPFALATSLATGNPVIDGLCNKTFASVEALLFNGDAAGFTKIGLKTTENETCMKQLVNYNVKLLNDLRDLERSFQFTIGVYNSAGAQTGTKTFVAYRDFALEAANPEAIQILYLYLDYYRNDEDLYSLPVALEIVYRTQSELASLNAIPLEQRTAEVSQRISVLTSKLPVDQANLATIQTRISKYVNLMNGSFFGYYASIITQYIGQNLSAPAAPERAAPAEAASSEDAPVANSPVQPAQPQA